MKFNGCYIPHHMYEKPKRQNLSDAIKSFRTTTMKKTNYNLQEIVNYQIYSSRWASYISQGWLQELSGKYYARKCTRRHLRYLKALDRAKKINEMYKSGAITHSLKWEMQQQDKNKNKL